MMDWSLSRERMFSRCPREMYCQYLAPADGREREESFLEEERRICRRKVSSVQYARNAVSSALREIFYNGSGGNAAKLVRRRMERDLLFAKCGENLAPDSGLPLWSDPENVPTAVDDILRNAFLPELETGLRKVPPLEKIPLASPLSVPLAGLTLWAAPVLAWHGEGRFCFLTFESQASVDTVLCRYALLYWRASPDRISFLRYDGRTDDAGKLDFSLELNHILCAAGQMYRGDYPRRVSEENCRSCRFRHCCGE